MYWWKALRIRIPKLPELAGKSERAEMDRKSWWHITTLLLDFGSPATHWGQGLQASLFDGTRGLVHRRMGAGGGRSTLNSVKSWVRWKVEKERESRRGSCGRKKESLGGKGGTRQVASSEQGEEFKKKEGKRKRKRKRKENREDEISSCGIF